MVNNSEILEQLNKEVEMYNKCNSKLGITLYYGRIQLLLSFLAHSKTHKDWALSTMDSFITSYNTRLKELSK